MLSNLLFSAIGRSCLTAAAASLFAFPTASAARGGPIGQDQDKATQSAAGPDVVVNGHRLKNGLPEVLNVNGADAQGRRHHQARAEQFAKCMMFFDPDLLRKAIDGPVHQSSTVFALGRLIQINFGCYRDQEVVPPREAAELGDCNAATTNYATGAKECRAPYDRAAIIRRVISKYAGPLKLTSLQTNDPAVQARFNAREPARNRLRQHDDMLMFEIAVCMVRIAPKDSVALVEETSTKEQYWLEDDIVHKARVCIGGAKQLGIDPAEFRDYVTDAVYRWIVAARDVETLVPTET